MNDPTWIDADDNWTPARPVTVRDVVLMWAAGVLVAIAIRIDRWTNGGLDRLVRR